MLIGIPLDQQSFAWKLEGPENGYFTESFRARSSQLSWAGYEPFAANLRKLADDVEQLGVTVYRSATLETLRLAAGKRQITIISHSRTAHFKEADIMDMARIREIVQLQCREAVPEEPRALAAFLNARFMPQRNVAQDAIGSRIQFQMQLTAARRSLMQTIPGALRGGFGVEFAEGFESPQAIASCIPQQFSGVIDLIVCNSLLVAESIRNHAPKSLAIGTSDLTFPETRLPFYHAILRLLKRRPQPYEDAMEGLKTVLRGTFS